MKKEISIKDLGIINTSGGNHDSWHDYFHIFSKNALFNYDTAKAINEHYVAEIDNPIRNDFKKHDILSGLYAIEPYGSTIDIKELKIPNFAEGIACPFSMMFSAGDDGMLIDDWFTSSTLNNFIDFKHRDETNTLGTKSESTIEIKDNMICFALFDPTVSEIDFNGIGLGFHELKDFFKIKNDENIKKFNIFISEKYRNLEPKKLVGGSFSIRSFCYKVSNGKFKIYDMWTNKSFLNSKMYNLLSDDLRGERISLGTFIRLK